MADVTEGLSQDIEWYVNDDGKSVCQVEDACPVYVPCIRIPVAARGAKIGTVREEEVFFPSDRRPDMQPCEREKERVR